MTPLRQRTVNDMTVRGFAENTMRSYLTSVTGRARHYRRSPDLISSREGQDYLIHLHEEWERSHSSCYGNPIFMRTRLDGPFTGRGVFSRSGSHKDYPRVSASMARS